ncbi:MAG: NAD(P)/FAD-dependent oxidoreductase [Pseudomonadota bacterium]
MNVAGEHITIIGAGLTGSLLAVMLARRNMHVTLLERQADPRKTAVAAGRSINLAMAARGLRGLSHAGLADAIGELQCPMPGRILHHADGTTSFQPYGNKPHEINYSVSRAGLNHLLLDAAEQAGAKVEFHQQCNGFDPHKGALSITDTRDPGNPYLRRVLRFIASDGAGSPVRRALQSLPEFTMDESLLGHRYQEIAIPPDASGNYAMDPGGLHVWPRGDFMLIALPNPGGDFTATLFMPESASSEPSFSMWDDTHAALAFFSETFADVPPLVPDLAEQLEHHPLGIMGTVRCNRWHWRDQCLLIGDAAHAIVPFHGQGMNAAFEDCVVFDNLIDNAVDWATLFSDFTDQRRKNADAIASMALENYEEMRDTVRDPRFHLKKALAFALEERCPAHFIPRYSMVMFHADIPYATAFERGAIQAQLLDEWTANAQSIDDIDLEHCVAAVESQLPPLMTEE